MIEDMLQTVMMRLEGLDDHLTFEVFPACPSGYLREELKSPFRRPEIRHLHLRVGRYHSDERNAREVQSLCHHLRPQQDIEPAVGKFSQDAVVCPLARCRIEVHPRNSCAGEKLLNLFLDPLSAEPPVL